MILNNLPKLLTAHWGGVAANTSDIVDLNGNNPTASAVPCFNTGTLAISNYVGGNTCTSTASGTPHTYCYNSLTFGSGTTEPTAEDYQMETPYDTTDHFEWKNQVQSATVAANQKVITASIANISEEDLTVSEIGVVLGSVSGMTVNTLLIARSLITPVTIAPNETKTFQYTLDLSGIAG